MNDSNRLFQAIERDVRRTSADQDENDLLHEALNRLTTLLTSLLTRTLGKYLHWKMLNSSLRFR